MDEYSDLFFKDEIKKAIDELEEINIILISFQTGLELEDIWNSLKL